MLLTISFLKNNYTSNFDSLFSPKEDKEVEFLSQNKYYEEVTGQRDRALVELNKTKGQLLHLRNSFDAVGDIVAKEREQ